VSGCLLIATYQFLVWTIQIVNTLRRIEIAFCFHSIVADFFYFFTLNLFRNVKASAFVLSEHCPNIVPTLVGLDAPSLGGKIKWFQT